LLYLFNLTSNKQAKTSKTGQAWCRKRWVKVADWRYSHA